MYVVEKGILEHMYTSWVPLAVIYDYIASHRTLGHVLRGSDTKETMKWAIPLGQQEKNGLEMILVGYVSTVREKEREVVLTWHHFLAKSCHACLLKKHIHQTWETLSLGFAFNPKGKVH